MITSDRIAQLDFMVYVDVSHAANIYGCSQRTILRRAGDHGVKTVTIGKKFFFMAKDFKRYMEDHPVGSYTLSPR